MKKTLLSLVTAFGVLASASVAPAQTLFTTFSDWSQYNGNGTSTLTPTAVNGTSIDSKITNGLGNTTNAGGTSTNGLLSVTIGNGGFDQFAISEAGNTNFINTLSKTTTLTLLYTNPTGNTSGSYFSPVALFLANNSNGFFQRIDPTTVVTQTNGSQLATYDFTSTAAQITTQLANGGYSVFNFGYGTNTNYVGGTFTIDAVNAVPEPDSVILVAISCLGLLLYHRRVVRD